MTRAQLERQRKKQDAWLAEIEQEEQRWQAQRAEQWERDHPGKGPIPPRRVRKGEHGFSIWIPLGTRKVENDLVEMNPEDRRFMLATIFDVAQTEDSTEY